MHSNTFLHLVQQEAGLNSQDEAKRATQLVFHLLKHRITQHEAHDVECQLPRDLAEMWQGSNWFQQIFSDWTPQTDYHYPDFLNYIEDHKGTITADARKMLKAVFYALQSQITLGEADHVGAQLPKDLKTVWHSAKPLGARPAAGGVPEEAFPFPVGGEMNRL